MARMIGNPIEQHGVKPHDQFAAITNALVRDGTISADAFRVLCLLLSHSTGYQESAASISEMYGWGRNRARATHALAELVDARLLVIQKHLTARGTRAFDKYHVHQSRRFDESEIERLSKSVSMGAPIECTEVHRSSAGGCTETVQGGAPQQCTTEEQLEEQVEEKLEGAAALIAKIIPAVHPRAVRTALEKRAAESLDGGTPKWAVEAALREWLVKSHAGVGVLPGLVSEALKAGPSDYMAQLQDAYDTGDISRLALRGIVYADPDDDIPDGLDLAGIRALNLSKKREWLEQLMETAQ